MHIPLALLLSFLFLPVICQTTQKKVILPGNIESVTTAQLEEITQLLGDARIIGTTERIHGYAEPFIFRNQLIRHLVEQQRIDVILLETGLLESFTLNDYIHNRLDNLDTARLYGFTSGKQTIKENAALLDWLREYNMDPANKRKVHICGFDVSGSMGAGTSRSEMNNPLITALNYYGMLEAPSTAGFVNDLDPYTAFVKTKPFRPAKEGAKTYEDLDLQTRNLITAGIEEMISNLQTYRFEYIRQTSESAHERALTAAIGARQIDQILRQLSLPGEPFSPESIDNSFFARLNAMCENVQYLLNRFPDSNFLIFGASNHLFKGPVETYWPDAPEPVILPVTVGQFLTHAYPENYTLISHFYLQAPDERNNLRNEAEFLSSWLTQEGTNYFMPVSELEGIPANKSIQIDRQNFLVPAESFDFVLFTEQLSRHERIE